VPDPDKRLMRELKRVLKKRGNKHRRHQLKRNLAENPEEAAENEEDLGKHRSDRLNGLDKDSTRKKEHEE
jgi:ribosome-interacting GTPase 1